MQIRPFRPSDTEAVVALWHECDLTRPWNDPHRDIERKSAVQPDLFLVGTVDDEPIASLMAGYDGHRGWLNYLAVAPGHRGLGFARALVREAEVRLEALGCPKVNLQVRAGNDAALGFYEALGYEPDGSISMGRRIIPD
jgi:ribosomal protein S18 acetylase RimI-like enzyme